MTQKQVASNVLQETVYSPSWEDMTVVVKLEERTLVVVGLADNTGLALVEDGGVNTVKETTQTQLNKTPLDGVYTHK